jgi:hypothetical protein
MENKGYGNIPSTVWGYHIPGAGTINSISFNIYRIADWGNGNSSRI